MIKYPIYYIHHIHGWQQSHYQLPASSSLCFYMLTACVTDALQSAVSQEQYYLVLHLI